MTITLDPGTTLAATDALKARRGRAWTDEQVAYLIALAYRSGLTTGHTQQVAELLATWADQPATPMPSRADRIAAEVAAAGPARFAGGLPKPVEYFPAEGRMPRFPTLEEQSVWLSAEDVAFCRRYSAEQVNG